MPSGPPPRRPQAHPYLADKGVQPHGLRQDADGRLMVPVRDADGRIWSLQRIGGDGFKQFEEGGRVEGGHYVIGDLKQPGPLLIAEGFATAATLHEMTGMPAIVAFNAGNLLAVAQTYRALDPDRVIVIAGRRRPPPRGGAGCAGPSEDQCRAGEGRGSRRRDRRPGGVPDVPARQPGHRLERPGADPGTPHAAGQLRLALAIGDRERAAQGLAAARDERGRSRTRPVPIGSSSPWPDRQGIEPGRRAPAQDRGHER